MAGAISGVAKQHADEEPRAVVAHCYSHSLNLACGDAIIKCSILKDALDTTHEVTKLIKFSPRRDTIFKGIQWHLIYQE